MNWELKPYDHKIKNELMDGGLLELFSLVLSNRNNGISQKSDITRYTACSLDDIDNPEDLQDMKKTSDIIREKIGGNAIIFGDYDVDGVSSSFMARRLLRHLGYADIKVFLPHRTRDGYGLNDNSVYNFNELTKNMSVDLIMVLDCGTSNRGHVESIRELHKNARFVILDHHIVVGEDLSSNADTVVNPRLNDAHPFCTGGLVYQLARQMLGDKLPVIEYLPYAALATVADVCHMQGANRIIVKNGLEMMGDMEDIGLKSLMKIAEINASECTEEDLGFMIGPMINAAGRLWESTAALKLLEAKSQSEAESMAQNLKAINDKRKEMQKQIVKEAEEKISRGIKGRNTILVHGDWNIGIVGIVAGRLAEKYMMPTLCLGKSENGDIVGSARSKGAVHLKNAMDDCSHIFLRYGGHEQAAGATLDPAHLDDAWDEFDAAVTRQMKAKGMKSMPILYDAGIDHKLLRHVNDMFCKKLELMGPFGSGNPRPVFLIPSVTCDDVKEWVSNKGGFVKLKETDMECFAMVPNVKSKLAGKRVDLLCSIVKSFKDDVDWSIKILNARLSGEG
jgi:single-stranded-DNA-specific exonuclease